MGSAWISGFSPQCYSAVMTRALYMLQEIIPYCLIRKEISNIAQVALCD